MYDYTLSFALQITRADKRPPVKWAVNLVIAYGHFNLPQGFVWASIHCSWGYNDKIQLYISKLLCIIGILQQSTIPTPEPSTLEKS